MSGKQGTDALDRGLEGLRPPITKLLLQRYLRREGDERTLHDLARRELHDPSGIVLATAVAAAGARGGVAAAPSFALGCGVMLAGTGPGGAGDALGAPACASSPHAFGFFLRRTTPSGGFGVTSARHEERAAKTPW